MLAAMSAMLRLESRQLFQTDGRLSTFSAALEECTPYKGLLRALGAQWETYDIGYSQPAHITQDAGANKDNQGS